MPGARLPSLASLLPRRARGPGIFLSYRRHGDSVGFAARLADNLEARFGEEQCFRDIEDIESGADFVRTIEEAITSCRVMIVVIGTDWISMTDAEGSRRLDDPDDFVRVEVAMALRRDIRVIPVLVCGASMPSPEDLPDDLQGLWRRQAVELTDLRWDYDVGRLVETIEESGVRRRDGAGSSVLGRALKTGLVAAVAVGLFLLGQFLRDELGGGSEHLVPSDPPPDEASAYQGALVKAIHLADSARNFAQESLDTAGLADVFEGPAYEREVDEVARLFGMDQVAYHSLHDQRFVDFRVNEAGSTAEVDVVESRSSERRNALTDACIFRNPVHDVRRTVGLRRTYDGWIVRSVTEAAATPRPDSVGC